MVGPVGTWFDLRDYPSVVFDEVPQTQLPPSISSISNVTVTVSSADGLEVDTDEMISPGEFQRDKDTLSVSATPVLRESLRISMVHTD